MKFKSVRESDLTTAISDYASRMTQAVDTYVNMAQFAESFGWGREKMVIGDGAGAAAMIAFRRERGLQQRELAELLNNALGRRYDGARISRWETGAERIPRAVTDLIKGFAVQSAVPKAADP